MQISYLEIAVSLVGFLVNVIAQVFVFRLIKSFGLLKSIFFGFAVGFACVVVATCYFYLAEPKSFLDFLAILACNLLTYFSLGYCYFHFINLGETARRIRIMRELYDSAGQLSMQEILQSYNAGEIVHRRFDRLLKSGQIIERDDRYYIGSAVLLTMAKIIVTMKHLFLGKERASR